MRARLTAAFVLVVLVPILVGALLISRALPGAVQDRQARGLTSAAQLVSLVLRGYCERARSTAEAAGRASTTVDAAGVRPALESLIARGLADGLRVIGPTGAVVAEVGDVPATAVDCSAGAPPTGGALTAVAELRTAAGRPVGRAVASYALGDGLLEGLRRSTGSDAVVLTGAGRQVAGTRSLPSSTVRAGLAHASGRTAGRLTAYVPPQVFEPYGVLLVAAPQRGPAVLLDVLGIVLGSVLIAGLLAFLLARATTRPLEELGVAAARIAGGDLETVIEVHSRDEVGRLATAFAAMTEDLRDYVGQLEASRDDLQAGLARLGDTLSSTHDLDRILHVVLESAIASTRAAGGMVLLLNAGRDQLVLSAAQGVEVPLDLTLPVGQGVSGVVAQRAEPLRGWVGGSPGQLAPAPGEPTGTWCVAVPLLSSGSVVGVLDLYGSSAPGGFDERDLATMRTFASQATVAVDNVMLHEEAQRLAITDGLTGLWNYRYFTMTAAKELERAARFGRSLSVLMLDLDHFKAVNDTFGHPRGDAVLVEVAARLKSQIRDVDTLARYGGEELVVVLPETDGPGALQVAERILAVVRGASFGTPDEVPIRLTLSAGVAVFPDHGASVAALLGRADEALYLAKRSGRDAAQLSVEPSAVDRRH